MALFIRVDVDPEVAKDPALVARLVEVCPVNIFASESDGSLRIVEENVDECTLCELCLKEVPPPRVQVVKLYEGS